MFKLLRQIANALRFVLSWTIGVPLALALSVPALVLWGASYLVDGALTHFTTKFVGGDIKKLKNPIAESIKGFFWNTAVDVWLNLGLYGPEVVAKRLDTSFYEFLERIRVTDKPTLFAEEGESVTSAVHSAHKIYEALSEFEEYEKKYDLKSKNTEELEQFVFKSQEAQKSLSDEGFFEELPESPDFDDGLDEDERGGDPSQKVKNPEGKGLEGKKNIGKGLGAESAA